jgi:ABC-2 type transport system ATP-binding protein
MDTIIATHGLTKNFSGRAVVNRVNLSIPQGAIFALLGGNGAGKSTTIKMLTGLLPPDAGTATVLGADCWADAIRLRHRIGYVPERPCFYDWMTVADIGWFSASFHKPGFTPRYHELLQRFRLDPAAKLKTLSKGGYAKVGLALALAPDPEVLILDEPTSGLDLFIRREFLASMVELAGAGRTILLSSHGVAEVERVASHAGFMAEGRILLAASIEELRKRIVRVQLCFDALPPNPADLGQVLEFQTSGRMWQAVLKDPNRLILEEARQQVGIRDLEEIPLSLEEMYTALLARFHRLEEPTAASNGQAQKSEVRDQKSEIRGQRSEVRDQKSEIRGQRSEVNREHLQ